MQGYRGGYQPQPQLQLQTQFTGGNQSSVPSISMGTYSQGQSQKTVGASPIHQQQQQQIPQSPQMQAPQHQQLQNAQGG